MTAKDAIFYLRKQGVRVFLNYPVFGIDGEELDFISVPISKKCAISTIKKLASYKDADVRFSIYGKNLFIKS